MKFCEFLRNRRAQGRLFGVGFIKPAGLMSKRSQGLPMEFIVIAVISILVLLVLVVIFMQSTPQTSMIDMQSTINICDSECLFAAQFTKSITKTDLESSTREFGFCKKSFAIKGMTGAQKCQDLVTCNLIFTDASGCKATCSGNNLRCA